MNNVWVQIKPEGGDLFYEMDNKLNPDDKLNPYDELSLCLHTMKQFPEQERGLAHGALE